MPSPHRPDHQQDAHFRVLRLLEQNPHRSQREIAAALGISLGQTNFLLKALLAKGYLELGDFQRGGQKLDKLAYLLTPVGLHQRLAMTRAYLERKTQEYQALQAELASLRAELGSEPPSEP
ncbi:MAG: MarR family EPS-associated transcriptional regulator [Chromatiaceae bacterium]